MSARALLCVLGLALAGCGGGVLAGAKTAPEPEERYDTLDQATAAFERYASELEGPYAQNDGTAATPKAGVPGYAQPPPGAPSSSMTPQMQPAPSADMADRASKPADTLDKEEAEPSPKNSCEIPCKAFASMKRAGQAICRLDTPDGAHCKQAKQRIAAATDRVASCGCAS